MIVKLAMAILIAPLMIAAAVAHPEAPSTTAVSADRMTISATTSAVGGPGYNIARTDGACASTPNNEQGGVCYRVCAKGIPGANSIASRSYEWRIANLGHGTPFIACERGGKTLPENCRAFSDEYYETPEGDATCTTFLLSGQEVEDSTTCD